ncbi:MAG: hypothetical protein HY306_00410 [Nitrosomonadales bacterium]|nr:hypothetical protein [Nitrosomonadales bacterium]
MGVVMNMSSYEIECDEAMETEYGAEMLNAGWNPALNLACQQYAHTDRHVALPSSLAAVDAEQFLQKMYACQR